MAKETERKSTLVGKRLLTDDSNSEQEQQPSPAKRLLLLPSGAGATGVNARLELIIGDRAGVE